MSDIVYRHAARPWEATFDDAPTTARTYYERLLQETLNYRLPARRRFGPVVAAGLRVGSVRRVVARLTARGARGPDLALDELRQHLESRWESFRLEHPWLGPRPTAGSVLRLQRSAGQTIFFFGDDPWPILVLKLANTDHPGLERESKALRIVDGLGLAPRVLVDEPPMLIQEGLRGRPIPIAPVGPGSARKMQWTRPMQAVAVGLETLARETGRNGPFTEAFIGLLGACREEASLSERARVAVSQVIADLRAVGRTVLQHGDASAQNCLVDRDQLIGFVDWENADERGVPGFDCLNFALSQMELGVGRVRWSEDRVLSAFQNSWDESAFWGTARRRAADCAAAAGIPIAAAQSLEVAFFARRVARRLDPAATHPTSAGTAIRMLEHVCARY